MESEGAQRPLMREDKGMPTSTNPQAPTYKHPPTGTKASKQEVEDDPLGHPPSLRPPASYQIKFTVALAEFQIKDLRFCWRAPFPWQLLNYHIEKTLYEKHPEADDPRSQRQAGLSAMIMKSPPMSVPSKKPSSMNQLSSNAPPLYEAKGLEEETDVEMAESSAATKAKESKVTENALLNSKAWTWTNDTPQEAFANENTTKHASIMEDRQTRFRKTFEELGYDYYDGQNWRSQYVNDEMFKDGDGNSLHLYLDCPFAKAWGW